MKLGKIITAIAAAAMSFASFGMNASDFKYSEFGDVPAKSIVCTNLQEVMTGVASEVNEKQDKFILGKNLQRGSTVFKLTLGNTDSLGGTGMFPYKSPIYSTGTNFLSNVKIYDYETREIPEIDPPVGASVVASSVGASVVDSSVGASVVSSSVGASVVSSSAGF